MKKKEVLKCLNTGWISPGGNNVKKFEKTIRKINQFKININELWYLSTSFEFNFGWFKKVKKRF